MCGIIGYYSKNKNNFDLSNGLNSISHRGPDNKGTFYNTEIGLGLGHVRLSIIDLSQAGSQPMKSANERYILSYNGEIYNHLEIRNELQKLDVVFSGDSDTEVLLELLSLKGIGALHQVQGIFAFALFDCQEESLIVVRDQFGVKPVYYTNQENDFFFSSEIKGLNSLGCDPGEIDINAVASHLAYLWNPRNILIGSNYKKLSPGSYLKILNGEIVEQGSWIKVQKLLPIKSKSPKKSKKALIKETENLLRRAVNEQMVSDVPLGAFLSGGLDSSSIVTFAREKNSKIECFTIDPKGGGEDGVSNDYYYAKEVARHLEVNLNVVDVSAETMVKDLSFMVSQFEEPIADPASLNTYYISKSARDLGIKVLLSGTGGDDIFTGYRRHQAIWWDSYIQFLPISVRNSLETLGSKFNQRNYLSRRLSKFFEGISLSYDSRLINYLYWSQPEMVKSLLSNDLKNEISREVIETPLREYLSSVESEDPIERMLEIEKRFFLAEHNLIYSDKMSMACGLEVRVPFLDKNLVDFTSTIPSNLKQRGLQGKWILKKAMEPYLPKNIIYRPKAGFGIPLRRWLKNDLKDFVAFNLSKEKILNRGLFDPQSVENLINANLSGRVDASYTILSLLCIELWCEVYLDNK